MRKLLLIILSIFIIHYSLTAQDLKYYLPENITYNPGIPKPKDIIYHEVREFHVTHDRLVNYMKAIAAAARQRIKLETMGFTYENRPQVLLIIYTIYFHETTKEFFLIGKAEKKSGRKNCH